MTTLPPALLGRIMLAGEPTGEAVLSFLVLLLISTAVLPPSPPLLLFSTVVVAVAAVVAVLGRAVVFGRSARGPGQR